MITSMVRLPPEARDQGLALVHTGRAAAVTLCQARRWRNAEGGPSVATGLRRRLRTPWTRVPPRSTACARPLSNRVWRWPWLASARPVGRIANWMRPRRLSSSRWPVVLRPPAADGGPCRDWPTSWWPWTLSTPSVQRVSAPRAKTCAPTVAAAMGDAPAGQRGVGLCHGGCPGGLHTSRRSPATAGVPGGDAHTTGRGNPPAHARHAGAPSAC